MQKQAQASILDPLTGPTPEQETGLNSSFAPTNLPLQSNQSPYSPVSQQNTGATSDSNNPFRRASASETPKNPYTHTREISVGSPGRTQEKGASSHVRQISNGTPEKGASSHVRHISNGSPRRERFPDMDPFSDDPTRRRSVDKGFRADLNQQGGSSGLRRNSSLKERFPGDKSVRPLDILREEERKASRAPHLKKRHIPGADSVDQLDETIGNKYHHEGPYDATLLARNTSFTSSPVAALKTTNEEALRATPSEAVKDSLDKHRPLDNTAAIAPGTKDQFGRRYEYEDGENMTDHLTRYEGVVSSFTPDQWNVSLTTSRTTRTTILKVLASQHSPLSKNSACAGLIGQMLTETTSS